MRDGIGAPVVFRVFDTGDGRETCLRREAGDAPCHGELVEVDEVLRRPVDGRPVARWTPEAAPRSWTTVGGW